MYILLQGQVAISAMSTVSDEPFAEAQPKLLMTYDEASDTPFFGELSLWLTKPRNGTAVAQAATRCLALPREHFESLLSLIRGPGRRSKRSLPTAAGSGPPRQTRATTTRRKRKTTRSQRCARSSGRSRRST